MQKKIELDNHIKNNPLLYKSFLLALEIIKLYKFLTTEKREFILSKQLLKSGTSIGANSNEAVVGQSKRDFSAKLGIARKEGYETKYWLNLLIFSEYLSLNQTERAYSLLDECMKIVCSSINTSKIKPKSIKQKPETGKQKPKSRKQKAETGNQKAESRNRNAENI